MTSVQEIPDNSNDLSSVEKEVVGANKAPIKLPLENGRTVEFKKPLGAISMKVANLLGPNSDNQALNIYYRMLLCITKIDGVPVSPPQSAREMNLLADRLGDDFDMVLLKFAEGEGEEPSIAMQLFGAAEEIKK